MAVGQLISQPPKRLNTMVNPIGCVGPSLAHHRAPTLWNELEHAVAAVCSSSAAGPVDWTARQRALQAFDALVLADVHYALGKRAEQSVWSHCHKACLDRAAGKLRMPVRRDVDAAAGFSQTYAMLLHSTYGHLLELLLKLCSRYGIKPVGVDSDTDPLDVMIEVACSTSLQKDGVTTEEQRASAKSLAYFLLVHIGDVCRYQKSVHSARGFYERAARLRPACGHAYNQLGILAAAGGDQLCAVYWYTRAAHCVDEPFEPAAANLDRCHAAVLAEVKEAGADGQPPVVAATEPKFWLQLFASLHDTVYSLGASENAEELHCTKLADQLVSEDGAPLSEAFLLDHFLHVFAVLASFFDKCFEGIVPKESVGVVSAVPSDVGRRWHVQYDAVEKSLSALMGQLLSLLVEHVDESFDAELHGRLVAHASVLAHWLDRLPAVADVRAAVARRAPPAFTSALVRWRNLQIKATDIDALIGGFTPLYGSLDDNPCAFSKTLAILARVAQHRIGQSVSSTGAVCASSSLQQRASSDESNATGGGVKTGADADESGLHVTSDGDGAKLAGARVGGKLQVRIPTGVSAPKSNLGDMTSVRSESAAPIATAEVHPSPSFSSVASAASGPRFEAARLRQALSSSGVGTPAMRASLAYADADRMAAAMARFMPPPPLPPQPPPPPPPPGMTSHLPFANFDRPVPTPIGVQPSVPPVFAVVDRPEPTWGGGAASSGRPAVPSWPPPAPVRPPPAPWSPVHRANQQRSAESTYDACAQPADCWPQRLQQSSQPVQHHGEVAGVHAPRPPDAGFNPFGAPQQQPPTDDVYVQWSVGDDST